MPLIDKPGFYFDMPAPQYHADPVKEPSLSSTVARILYDESPHHARYAHPRLRNLPWKAKTIDRGMDMGSAVHKLILRKGQHIDTIPFDDYKKKEPKEMREQSRAVGNIPILQSDMADVNGMVAGISGALKDMGREDIFESCHTEVVLIWQEPNGVWCRAMLDALPKNYETTLHLRLPELKSTDGSADVESFQRTLFNQGYDVQTAFYKRGLRALLPKHSSFTFEYVVMEQNAPWAVNILNASAQAEAEADTIARIAIEGWGVCMKSGRWPSYVGGEMIDVQTFRSMQREAKNRWLLELMKDWQAPL